MILQFLLLIFLIYSIFFVLNAIKPIHNDIKLINDLNDEFHYHIIRSLDFFDHTKMRNHANHILY